MQLAEALPVLVRHDAAGQRLTLHLAPEALGRIEIVLHRPPGAPAEVSLTADKPETLLRLVRDRDSLDRALDKAGLPAEARHVTFHLATPDPRPPDPAPLTAAAMPLPQPGAGGQPGQHGQDPPGHAPRRERGAASAAEHSAAVPAAATPAARGGIDITA